MLLAAALNYDAASAAATSMRDTLLPVTYFLWALSRRRKVTTVKESSCLHSSRSNVILTANYPTAITILRTP
jgi:hypothetical protein